MLYRCPECKEVYGSDAPVACPVCKAILLPIREEREQTTNQSPTANLVLGALFLIAGIVGFMLAGPKMDVIRSGLGQFAAALSESAAREFQMWQYAYYGSIVALIIGGLFVLAGVLQQVQKR